MKVTAKTRLKYGGKIHEEGAALEMKDADAKAAIESGYVTKGSGGGKGKSGNEAAQQPAELTPEQRHAAMVEVMRGLTPPDDPVGSEQFTNDGKPECDYMASLMEVDSVSADERDAAWAEASQ